MSQPAWMIKMNAEMKQSSKTAPESSGEIVEQDQPNPAFSEAPVPPKKKGKKSSSTAISTETVYQLSQ
jgi:hypothetical protein